MILVLSTLAQHTVMLSQIAKNNIIPLKNTIKLDYEEESSLVERLDDKENLNDAEQQNDPESGESSSGRAMKIAKIFTIARRKVNLVNKQERINSLDAKQSLMLNYFEKINHSTNTTSHYSNIAIATNNNIVLQQASELNNLIFMGNSSEKLNCTALLQAFIDKNKSSKSMFTRFLIFTTDFYFFNSKNKIRWEFKKIYDVYVSNWRSILQTRSKLPETEEAKLLENSIDDSLRPETMAALIWQSLYKSIK
jgi:hypothetical protein